MDDVRQAVMMTEIASSDRLWTRAAVRGGRIFICFPRWFSDNYMRMSLGEVVSPGTVKPFPEKDWNNWNRKHGSPDKQFICVQSVYFDDEGFLWVLDAANPSNPKTGEHEGVFESGPKLHKFNVQRNEYICTYDFSERSYWNDSYFNDVRVCNRRKKAFITDSGAGGLIVVDLKDISEYDRDKDNWCLLDSQDRNSQKKVHSSVQDKAHPSVQDKAHPSVQDKAHPSVQDKAHPSVQGEGVELIIEGRRWLQNGKVPKVHSDGIALSPDRKYLYYQALTGRTLYRIRTESLIKNKKNSEELFSEVQEVGQTGAADGIQFGADGRLYLTAIEKNAITRLVHPHDSDENPPKGEVETVFCSKDCQWPDSLTRTADGSLYVTTSRIHLQDDDRRKPPRGPFKLFRLQVGKLGFF